MNRKLKLGVMVGLAVGGLAAGWAAPVNYVLPEEKARLAESPLPGYALATTLCYTCHSVDYVKAQPVSARTYWKATVVKMQKTFGAPIPDEAVEPLTDYLVKTYGAERAKPAIPLPPGKG